VTPGAKLMTIAAANESAPIRALSVSGVAAPSCGCIASNVTKHADIVAMLKADHGMTHSAAHRVSVLSRQEEASAGDDPADALYAGRKAICARSTTR